MKGRGLALSMAAAAGVCAPFAGAVVTAAPAGATSCPAATGVWAETREVPLLVFGTNVGKTSLQIAVADSGCDGDLDAKDRVPGYVITNPAVQFCGFEYPGGVLGEARAPTEGWADGWAFQVRFKFTLSGGPCTTWNDQGVAMWTNGGTAKAHGRFCYADTSGAGFNQGCKEVD